MGAGASGAGLDGAGPAGEGLGTYLSPQRDTAFVSEASGQAKGVMRGKHGAKDTKQSRKNGSSVESFTYGLWHTFPERSGAVGLSQKAELQEWGG